jgi:hypothetical protein
MCSRRTKVLFSVPLGWVRDTATQSPKFLELATVDMKMCHYGQPGSDQMSIKIRICGMANACRAAFYRALLLFLPQQVLFAKHSTSSERNKERRARIQQK